MNDTKVAKAKITIAFEGERASELADLTRGVDLNTLLRDALGEFCRAREPVEEYVAKRYAGQGDAFRCAKVREVHKRLQLADVLRLGHVEIEVDIEIVHCRRPPTTSTSPGCRGPGQCTCNCFSCNGGHHGR